jgi:hypothetical protein
MLGKAERGTVSIAESTHFHFDPMANLVDAQQAVDVTDGNTQNEFFLLNVTGEWPSLGQSDVYREAPVDVFSGCLGGTGRVVAAREKESASITFDYSLMLDCDSPVYRCMDAVCSNPVCSQSPMASQVDLVQDDTKSPSVVGTPFQKGGDNISGRKRATYSPRNRYSPRMFPAIQLTNHLFVVDGDVNSVTEKVFAWVDSKPLITHDFIASDLTWSCKLNDHYSQSMFDITVYRFDVGHPQQGKFAVELLRTDGEKYRIHQLFAELRNFFCSDELNELALMAVDSSGQYVFEGSSELPPLLDPAHISEDRIKQTILSALQDAACEYSSKVEAIKMAGCILSKCTDFEAASEMDKKIILALDSLSASDSAFRWVTVPPTPNTLVECH